MTASEMIRTSAPPVGEPPDGWIYTSGAWCGWEREGWLRRYVVAEVAGFAVGLAYCRHQTRPSGWTGGRIVALRPDPLAVMAVCEEHDSACAAGLACADGGAR